MTQTAEIMIEESNQIAVYKPFAAQLAELKKANESIVFDYETPKGEKEARSHIHKLRLTKGAVDKAREAEKKASLEYGRKVDSQAKEIITELEEMIEVHSKPIKEKEEREERRIAALKERIEFIRSAGVIHKHETSSNIQAALTHIEEAVIDETFGEYYEPAIRAKNEAISALKVQLAAQCQAEKDKEELEKLRQESAAREQKQREEKLIAEAEERTRQAAEAAAQAERNAAALREQEANAARERAEREARQAEENLRLEKERAERQAEQAAEAARREEQAKAQRIKDEEAAREKSRTHQAFIHTAIISAMKECGASVEMAKSIIVAIREERIPHIKINY